MQQFKLFTLPNIITLLNLSAGFFAILYAISGSLQTAGILILAAGIFDFLDGFTARLTRQFSPVGEQLDSLADLVSFGVAPGFISMQLLQQVFYSGANFPAEISINHWPLLSALLIPAFSALRLAKFNIDQRQQTSFMGLPTPANALFFASLPFLAAHFNLFGAGNNFQGFALAAVTAMLAVLLVVEMPMFALKFKSYKPKKNIQRYGFLLLAVVVFITFKMAGLSFIIIIYIMMAFIENITNLYRQKKKTGRF